MAFRVHQREAMAGAVKRIAREQITRCLADLAGCEEQKLDRVVHDVRRQLKRVRAAVQLVRPQIGRRTVPKTARVLRDAARPLAELRDARVLCETLEDMSRAAKLAPEAAARLRAMVESRYKLIRQRVLDGANALGRIAARLQEAMARIDGWTVRDDRSAEIAMAVKRAYKRAIKAGRKSERKGTDQNLHEWRKATKRLWHELEVICPIAPAKTRPMMELAHRLSAQLGEDHDLAVLQRVLRDECQVPSFRGTPRNLADPAHRLDSSEYLGMTARALTRVIAMHRRRLQALARATARRLFARAPKNLAQEVERSWQLWRESAVRRVAAGSSRVWG